MLNNHDVSFLFSFGSKTAREFKANFPYNEDQTCPMDCGSMDTEEHILRCQKLNSQSSQDNTLEYSDLFSTDTTKQGAITKYFQDF